MRRRKRFRGDFGVLVVGAEFDGLLQVQRPERHQTDGDGPQLIPEFEPLLKEARPIAALGDKMMMPKPRGCRYCGQSSDETCSHVSHDLSGTWAAIFSPETAAFVSTREDWDLCVELARGGGCLFTLNCSTTPGGYSLQHGGCQFAAHSYDAPIYAAKLRSEGLDPIFHWNADELIGKCSRSESDATRQENHSAVV